MRITIKAGDINVTDEYGKPMYESGFHAGMELFAGQATQLQITDYGKLLIEVGLGRGLHPIPGTGPSPIPPPGDYVPPPVEVTPPPTTPPPTGGGVPPTGPTPPPVNGGEIPWPASGQVVMHVNMQANQTVRYTMKWASSMDPSKTGFIRVCEEPGSAVMFRHLKVSVNGAVGFDSTPYNDTGPSCGLCNYPTPGNASTVQVNSGDVLGIEVTNGSNPTPAPCNMLLDIAVPDRY